MSYFALEWLNTENVTGILSRRETVTETSGCSKFKVKDFHVHTTVVLSAGFVRDGR